MMPKKRRPPKHRPPKRKPKANPNASRARAREAAVPAPGPAPASSRDTYTEQTGLLICAWIALGRTLSDYCRSPGAPGWTTVHDWLERHPDFRKRYDRARVLFGHAVMEETLRIADTPMLGEIETIEEVEIEVGSGADAEKLPAKKRKVTKEDMLGHRKLQIETRMKLLARCFPSEFGPHMKLDHKGKVTLESLVAGSMDDDPTDPTEEKDDE